MVRKAAVWGTVLAVSGLLVYGALLRTSASSDRVPRAEAAVAAGQGEGAGGGGRHARAEGQPADLDRGRGAGRGRTGEAGNRGGGAEHGTAEWDAIDGIVESVGAEEMVVRADGGEAVTVEGMPWSYVRGMGFPCAAGDAVTLRGFVEDGEFKAAEIENRTAGERVTLRDESGRPMWAGQGRGR